MKYWDSLHFYFFRAKDFELLLFFCLGGEDLFLFVCFFAKGGGTKGLGI